MMPTITYNGKSPRIELVGFGHFAPGDKKQIDDLTAAAMSDDAAKAEGWSVELGDKKTKKSADANESTKPAAPARRSHSNDE